MPNVPISRKLSVFILLGLFSICVHTVIGKFDKVGGQLLANPVLATGLQGWQANGPAHTIAVTSKGVRLQLDDEQISVQISQRLNRAMVGKMVVLKARVKTIGIQGGKINWEKGRVLLVQYVGDKAIYNTPHSLVALDGTHDWAEYSAAFSILPNASEVRVVLQLSHCRGEIWIENLELFRVIEKPLYKIARLVVFGLWGIFLACIFFPEMVGNWERRKWSAPIALVVIAIIFSTTIPAKLKHEAKGEIISRATTYVSEMVDYRGKDVKGFAAEVKEQKWLRIDITKVAHFLLFAFLCVLLVVRKRDESVWPVMVDIVILACATELMQLFIDGRSALVGDVFIDLAGAGFMILLLKKNLQPAVGSLQ